MIIIIVKILGDKKELIMIISKKLGTDISISTKRIIKLSVTPPIYPLIVPNNVPTIIDTSMEKNPTVNETLPPYKALVNNLFQHVPFQKNAPYPLSANLLLKSIASGSYDERGAKSEAIIITPSKIRQIIANLFSFKLVFKLYHTPYHTLLLKFLVDVLPRKKHLLFPFLLLGDSSQHLPIFLTSLFNTRICNAIQQIRNPIPIIKIRHDNIVNAIIIG